MRISTLFPSLVFLIISLCVRTFGGGVDHNFKTQITNADGTYVSTIAVQPDGKILVGGKFGYINGEQRPYIARLNADGTFDASFNPNLSSIFSINCFLVQPDGKIFVGGTISATYNGVTRGGLIRLNPDGSLDPTFFNGTGTGNVKTIAVQPDGKVVVGGTFDSAEGVTRRRLARFNPDGSLDMSFDPNPLGDAINSVQALPDGKVLIGGDFYNINGQPIEGFVRLNQNGSIDQTFQTFGVSQVNIIKLLPDGKFLIAGRFLGVNNILRRTVARLNPDGTLDESFTLGENLIYGNPYSVELLPGGEIILGGSLSEHGATFSLGLLRVGPAGNIISSFPAFINSPVQAVARQTDGLLLIGGARPGDQSSRSLFRRININGATDTSFPAWVSDPFDALGPPVVQPDGKILIYGDFTEVNGVDRKRVARLNRDGSVDLSFNPGTGVNYEITDLALQPDGKMVIGGDFGRVNGVSQTRLARLNPDGSRDATFNTGVGFDRIVTTVVIAPDGKIVVGGIFDTVNWVSRPRIARLNSDGSLDTGFNVGMPGPNNAVHDIHFLPAGKILISGPFGNINGVPTRRMARLNAEGSIDPTFNPGGAGADGFDLNTVASMAIQPDGKIVFGGTFLNYNGVPRVCLGRIYGDGSLDMEFAPATQNVYDVKLMPDGKIIVSGNVQTINDIPQRYITRLNPDGTVDASFNIGTGPSDKVAGVARQSNGDLIVTGRFLRFDGRTHIGIAKLRAGSGAPYDFDGDGKSDISVFRPADGVWYLNRSAEGFGALQFGIASDKLAPADYDGDGKTDIAVFRDGNWYLQRSQAGFAAIQFGAAGDIPQPADFDGDGKAELAVFRPSTGSWYVLNLVNNQFNGIQFGISSDKPVAADYDGDGKADYAVFRPSDGTWYLLRSQQGFTGVQFGISTDKPVAGDYDGDGKADPAVYRGGVWYQLRSSQGFAATQFGISTDLPAPGDYDGDGKSDLAVYRDNTWYLLRSNAGFTGLQFGATGDKPVPNAFVQ